MRKLLFTLFFLFFLPLLVFSNSLLKNCLIKNAGITKQPVLGWYSNYTYRARIPVNYTNPGTQTNYTKQIAIVKGPGTNTAGTIYLNNHAQHWPYDIRFTQRDGTTLLDFYREEYDATDGTWYVELNPIYSGGNTDFYVYYGNAAVTDDTGGSNGDNTFLFFDDFESGNLNKWTSVTSWAVDASHKFEGNYGATGSPGWNDIYKTQTFRDCVIGGRAYAYDTAHYFYPSLAQANNGIYIGALVMDTGNWRYENNVDRLNLPTNPTYSATTWYKFEVAIDFTNSKLRFINIDGHDYTDVPLVDLSGNTWTGSNYLTRINIESANSSVNCTVDQVYVRAYVYPEPAWASPGAEESP